MDIYTSLSTKSSVPLSQSFEVNIPSQATEKPTVSTAEQLEEDKVTISPEAYEKLKLNNKQESTETEGTKDRREQMIEDIKEKIKQLELELKQLKGDKSEQSLQRQKLIQDQILALNSTLLKLISEQLDTA